MLSLKKKTSKLNLYNSYLIFLAFLICRILPILPIWGQLISLVGSSQWNEINTFHKCICIFTSIPLDILNVFWFYKIIKIFLKHRKDGNKSE